ncbi:MAG TPA: AMP-binding protein, partial [Pyrinomonadaceae bacterium]|nr:AMP-binding protein [Pyrinomonadaceae bacterium]
MSQTNAHDQELPTTLPTLCLTALKARTRSDALSHREEGKWLHISSAEIWRRVRALALALDGLGIRKGDRIEHLSENRPEWSMVDLAILSLGAINVPIYTTQAVEQVRYILEDSQVRMLFVSNRRVFRHARPGIEPVESLERMIFFDEPAEGLDDVLTLAELEARGAVRDATEPEAFDELVSVVEADDLATIIYTSGTTGEPKGVMLTHANFVSNVYAIARDLPISSADVSLSVLPLSHIFERTAFYVFCWVGMSVHYAPSVDQLAEYLREVRPTVMTAVPRLFEKVYHRIVKKGMSATGWRQKLFAWALETGKRY